MATINNKYDIGSKVCFVENNKIKNGEITSIIYRGEVFFDYIIDDGKIEYSEKQLATTPEKALKNYIEIEKSQAILFANQKYDRLYQEIFDDWAKNPFQ